VWSIFVSAISIMLDYSKEDLKMKRLKYNGTRTMKEAKEYVKKLLDNYPSLEVGDIAINKSDSAKKYWILINIDKLEPSMMGMKIK